MELHIGKLLVLIPHIKAFFHRTAITASEDEVADLPTEKAG